MNHVPRTFGRSSRVAAVIALAALTLVVPAGRAQTPVSEADTTGETHPAHIHSGSCDQLGDVVVPLNDVTSPAGEHVGSESAHAVKTSMNVVDMPLQELIDGDYAINVHKSADEIDVYIACGDIGGVLYPDVEGGMDLTIGLRELNGSGYAGTAWLGGLGEKTEVAIDLVGPDQID
jgi:hypothetical protein